MKLLTGMLMMAAVLVCARGASASEMPAALMDPYLQIQAALSTDQFEGVTASAQAIEKAASSMGAAAAAVAGSAGKVAAAKDLAAARTAFGELSEALVAYAQATGSELGPDVRVAYCPMKNKPWLTKDKTIRNPYFGAAMLTCGSFKQ